MWFGKRCSFGARNDKIVLVFVGTLRPCFIMYGEDLSYVTSNYFESSKGALVISKGHERNLAQNIFEPARLNWDFFDLNFQSRSNFEKIYFTNSRSVSLHESMSHKHNWQKQDTFLEELCCETRQFFFVACWGKNPLNLEWTKHLVWVGLSVTLYIPQTCIRIEKTWHKTVPSAQQNISE